MHADTLHATLLHYDVDKANNICHHEQNDTMIHAAIRPHTKINMYKQVVRHCGNEGQGLMSPVGRDHQISP